MLLKNTVWLLLREHLILKSILLKQLLLEVTHKRDEPSLLPLCDGIKDLSDKLA